MKPIFDIRNWRVVALSETDDILVGETWEGLCILGAPGSGKSANVGKQLARGYLRTPGMGGLILTAKAEETTNWIRLAEENGRANDLIVVNEKSGHLIDPIAAEWLRDGRGAGDIENVIDFFTTLVSLGKK